MIYALIGCLIIIGFLGVKLYQKQKIDKEEYQLYQDELKQIKQDVKDKRQNKKETVLITKVDLYKLNIKMLKLIKKHL